MELLKLRLANLLSVKSLVTLVLTIVFSVLSMKGAVSQDFMTIYTVIVAFYFGTQAAKDKTAEAKTDAKEDAKEESRVENKEGQT